MLTRRGRSDGSSVFVRGVCFSEHSSFLLTASEDNILRLWNARSARCVIVALISMPIASLIMTSSCLNYHGQLNISSISVIYVACG